MPILAYPHIQIKDGTPTIQGTRVKVVHLAIERLAHEWTPDEMRRQHPFLTLAQIHSAMAYYYDHQAEMDLEIERRLHRENELVADQGDSPVRAKLLVLKYGPGR